MTTTRIPTQAEYVAYELRRVHAEIQARESAPIQDRRDAKKKWSEALTNLELIRERAEWLVNGSYGFGQCLMAKRACTGRGNKVARFAQLLAVFEWQCPRNMAAHSWLALTPEQQTAVNNVISEVITNAEWATTED